MGDKRDNSHGHPSSNRQKREAMAKKKKAREYALYVAKQEGKLEALKAEVLRKKRMEEVRKRGKGGSHRIR
jgi:hypothetical protein